MAPDSGFDTKLQIISIRLLARKIVGPCTDYQIIFVAYQAGVLKRPVQSLDRLDMFEVDTLASWLLQESEVHDRRRNFPSGGGFNSYA